MYPEFTPLDSEQNHRAIHVRVAKTGKQTVVPPPIQHLSGVDIGV